MKRMLGLFALLLTFSGGLASAFGGSASAAPLPAAVLTSSCYPTCVAPTTVPPTITSATLPATSVTPADGGAPQSTQATPQAGQSLAFTGADVAGTVALAVIVLGLGLVMVQLSRRRHHA